VALRQRIALGSAFVQLVDAAAAWSFPHVGVATEDFPTGAAAGATSFLLIRSRTKGAVWGMVQLPVQALTGVRVIR
jgi:hypothetical protein